MQFDLLIVTEGSHLRYLSSVNAWNAETGVIFHQIVQTALLNSPNCFQVLVVIQTKLHELLFANHHSSVWSCCDVWAKLSDLIITIRKSYIVGSDVHRNAVVFVYLHLLLLLNLGQLREVTPGGNPYAAFDVRW